MFHAMWQGELGSMFALKFCIAVLGLLICTSSASAQKIERFKDSQGTLHIGTQPDAKPRDNTRPDAKPEVKPEAKPGDIAKPESEPPFQRKVLPKAQRVSRRPLNQYPPGEFPPRHLPSPYQRPVVKPQPGQPEPPKGAPGPAEGQKGANP